MFLKLIQFSICSSAQSTRPLYSFEDSCDYVYDAMWSPTHPALFACVDLAGRLDLWNLNNDTEVRIMHNALKKRSIKRNTLTLYAIIHLLRLR